MDKCTMWFKMKNNQPIDFGQFKFIGLACVNYFKPHIMSRIKIVLELF